MYMKAFHKKDAKKTEVEKFLLYLPPAMKSRLRDEAESTFRSINGQILYILNEYFSRKTGMQHTG